MKKIILIAILSILIFLPNILFAQDNNKYESMTREEILQLSLEDLLALPFEDLLTLANKLGVSIDDLLKMKTTVASKTAINPRETPGIVSIITSEEIKNSGARDLIDVIKLIPGLNIQYDDAGVFGIQMRGNWGFEGKVLVLIDGQEFNDLKYNVVPFGHHFNVHQIKRIEIIRGPGSSIYGGNAELGVINIITKNGSDINGFSVSADGALFSDFDFGFGKLNFNAGKQIGEWNLSATSSINKALMTDRNINEMMYDYDDSVYYINSYPSSDSSCRISSFNLNFAASTESFGCRFIMDNYVTNYLADNYPNVNEFKTLLGEIKYDFEPSDKLTITPKFNFKNSIPYYYEGWYTNMSTSRYTGNATINWNPLDNLNFVGGIENYYDYSKMLEDTDSSLFYINDRVNGESSVSFDNLAVYLQSILNTKYLNLIVGGRFDKHSYYGNAFAPRIGITKVWEAFHVKALYSKSFRSPSFGNIEFYRDIKPENTRVVEFESGYKLNNNMFITSNFYHININNPIIWYINEYEEYGYKNDKKTGTWGYEIEYKFKYNWGYGNVNYSFYQPIEGNTVEIYKTPEKENSYIGSPNHKVSINASFKLNKYISFNPSIVYTSDIYGLSHFDENDSIILKNYGNSMVFNLFLVGSVGDFEFGAGVFDLFNDKPVFVQPYQGGWNLPYPAPSRQFVMRATYNFSFD